MSPPPSFVHHVCALHGHGPTVRLNTEEIYQLSTGLGAHTTPKSTRVGALCAPIFKIFIYTSTRKQLVEQKYASHVLFLGAFFALTFYLVKTNVLKVIKSKQQ